MGYIRLDHFLKLNGIASTGGQAKVLIQSGEVQVDGEVEFRRGRKLRDGELVEFGGQSWPVEFVNEDAGAPDDGAK